MRLYQDYFALYFVYSEEQFKRSFHVTRALFDITLSCVCETDFYFVQRKDANGRWGLTALRMAACAFRILAYGSAADSVDEYLRMV